MEKKVFLVQFRWSTEEDNGVKNFVFGEYKDAYKKYEELVNDELNPLISWVGEVAMEENLDRIHYSIEHSGKPNGEEEAYFYAEDELAKDYYSFINLFIMEVK